MEIREGAGDIAINGKSLLEVGVRWAFHVVFPRGELSRSGAGALRGDAGVSAVRRVGEGGRRRDDGSGGGCAIGAGEGDSKL